MFLPFAASKRPLLLPPHTPMTSRGWPSLYPCCAPAPHPSRTCPVGAGSSRVAQQQNCLFLEKIVSIKGKGFASHCLPTTFPTTPPHPTGLTPLCFGVPFPEFSFVPESLSLLGSLQEAPSPIISILDPCPFQSLSVLITSSWPGLGGWGTGRVGPIGFGAPALGAS